MDDRKKTDIPANIPQPYKEKYAVIVSMITPFCDEKLDDDYKALCIHALQKLCRKRTEPMAKGRDNMWAARIVYAIAQNCNLVGNNIDILMGRPKYHLTADEVSSYFGVSKGGMSEKAKAIREELSITKDREEWMIPSWRDDEARKAFMAVKRRFGF